MPNYISPYVPESTTEVLFTITGGAILVTALRLSDRGDTKNNPVLLQPGKTHLVTVTSGTGRVCYTLEYRPLDLRVVVSAA